ncbi:DNA-binding response regulator [Actinoplanes sp. NBRC 14428]|uniref:LuxR family two component transcriptional regulator n=1 Tax=Pseudosporangium ferrugineum TaxID=439699 RepID=A0A2T0RQI4_9ACTN|nr:response regulator transcription factor [Pseudosporangium ferrugineum]PRY23387.1 LuxR family two component transcriptional regulator [Pseudosporangium ferrugineum]BCJ55376.1 DNA-binding response regulator [Actinoplanes sp. NBRC 14428]
MTGPVRVLLCDDEETVRSGYATIFSAEPDLEVVGEAADGHEAVRLAGLLRPDVAVMDVRMPVMDGIEATRCLAGPEVAEPVKVLVVTTFNVDEYVYAALRAGASGFLLKDAPYQRLVDGIRTVAGGDSLLAPAVTRRLIGHFAERLRPDTSSPARDTVIGALTAREVDVFKQIAAGRSNAEIAAGLVLSLETVKTYVSRILAKLGLRDRVHVAILAYRIGLGPDDG